MGHLTVLTLSHFVFLAFILVYFGKNNSINKFMLKSLKRAVIPGPFSRSCFKVSDQTKNLIKRNRPVIFSHQQLKNGFGIRDRVWTTYQMANLHIMVANSMLLAPQWYGFDSRNWQFLKFLKLANVAEFQMLPV